MNTLPTVQSSPAILALLVETAKIRTWLADTTEPMDDWHWDGQELHVFLDEKLVELYSRQDLVDPKILDA